ncbi:Histone-lysine N-methyltransferase SMYD3 [Channa argus]|uniref:Histone-lysine N-methyltransferase SMYD3 n=1 Tax=Channa argus TaxID=215402 RepID=A0A6G1P7M6_CHAAH|nr:Histone-lysine N-methyltransferase SMYD3 [Channa argus]
MKEIQNLTDIRFQWIRQCNQFLCLLWDNPDFRTDMSPGFSGQSFLGYLSHALHASLCDHLQTKEGFCQIYAEIENLEKGAFEFTCCHVTSFAGTVGIGFLSCANANLLVSPDHKLGFDHSHLSLLNHDCRPNCVMVFEGTKLQLRAVRDINPAEELTISYIETLSLTEDRQRQLEDQYHFTCHCQRCDSRDKDELMLIGEETTWHQLKEGLPRMEGLKAELGICPFYTSHCVVTDRFRFCWLTNSLLFVRIHINLLQLDRDNREKTVTRGTTTKAAESGGERENGLTSPSLIRAARGAKSPDKSRQYYPEPHPVHGVQLMRVGKLQHYLEHVPEALDTFKQVSDGVLTARNCYGTVTTTLEALAEDAYEIIKLTHGDDHPLTTDLLMKMEECHCELRQRSSSSH